MVVFVGCGVFSSDDDDVLLDLLLFPFVELLVLDFPFDVLDWLLEEVLDLDPLVDFCEDVRLRLLVVSPFGPEL